MMGMSTCSGCGADVVADFAFCPRCGRRQPAPCAACGFVCEPTFAFCPRCGAARGAGAASPTPGAAVPPPV
ncbi:MAG TPA: zinc ribbon domain-containing protein, partial [Methylomirabilota bacterium]